MQLPDLGAKYQLVGPLVERAGAVTYRARQHLLDRDVAVTVFEGLDEGAIARLAASAGPWAAIEHPAVLRLLDVEVLRRPDAMSTLVVTEYVEGPTLRRRTGTEPPLTAATAARLLSALCEACACAHEAGAVHGHLDDEAVIVVDDRSVAVGGYGGPELWTSQPVPGDDVAALGRLAVSLLAPELSASPATKRVVKAALSASPADRPTAARLGATLAALAESLDPAPRSPPADRRPRSSSPLPPTTTVVSGARPAAPETHRDGRRTWHRLVVGCILVGVLSTVVVHIRRSDTVAQGTVDCEDLVLRRPQRAVAAFSWRSRAPYRGRVVFGRGSDGTGATAFTAVEPTTTTSHVLYVEGLKAHEVYTAILSDEATRRAFHSTVVYGRPRLVRGPYVYPRRCRTDVDWVTDVRLANPRLLVRFRTASGAEVREVKARHHGMPDGTFSYSATCELPDPEPPSACVAGLEEDLPAFPLVLDAETIAETTPDARPMVSTSLHRAILDAIAATAPAEAATYGRALPPWLIEELAGRRREHLPDFVAGPIVAGSHLVVGDQAGTLRALPLPENDDFVVPRPHRDTAWAVFDDAANYDGVAGLAFDGRHVIAQFVRTRGRPVELRTDSPSVAAAWKSAAAEHARIFWAKSGQATEDVFVMVEPAARTAEWRRQAQGRIYRDVLAAGIPPCRLTTDERRFPLLVRDGDDPSTDHRCCDRPVDWCAVPGTATLAGVLAADWTKPPTQILRILSTGAPNGTAVWRPGLDGLGRVDGEPVVVDEVVYLRLVPREVDDLGAVARSDVSSKLVALCTRTGRTWQLTTPGTLQFSRLFVHVGDRRILVADHTTVYVLSAKARTARLRNGSPVPDGLLPEAGEFAVPLSAATALLPTEHQATHRCILATPVLVRPRRWGDRRELLMLCCNAPPESRGALTVQLRTVHTNVALYMFELEGTTLRRYVPFVADGRSDYGRMTSASTPDALGHHLQRDETRTTLLFGILGRLFVFDLTAEPTLDATTGRQRHVLLDHEPAGGRIRAATLHENCVFYADFEGRLRRVAFSPTRLPSPVDGLGRD